MTPYLLKPQLTSLAYKALELFIIIIDNIVLLLLYLSCGSQFKYYIIKMITLYLDIDLFREIIIKILCACMEWQSSNNFHNNNCTILITSIFKTQYIFNMFSMHYILTIHTFSNVCNTEILHMTCSLTQSFGCFMHILYFQQNFSCC